jgi:tetratricopeptide (TPR) repeat protein
VKPANRDRLLYLLDKGMILHAAGKYEESNRVLTQAEELAKVLYAKSLTREVAATLWSEEAREYPGERHERALIPTVRMLNYIMMDEWDEALVEVRRLGTTVEEVYGEKYKYSNAFSLYLSAIVWEAMGQINDALIDYKKLRKQGADVPYYGHDMRDTSRQLGMQVKLPPKGSEAWQKSTGYRKRRGELIVIASTGRSPRFVSEWESTGYFSVSMPNIIYYSPSTPYATVVVDGKELGTTHPFYNIVDDIMVALKERAKRSMIRQMVKLSVQTGLYTGGLILMDSDDTKQQLAGLALSLLAMSMSASDKADERSWRTLPAEFQIGRFYLEPGEHEVEIVPEGADSTMKRSVDISGERPSVILARFGGVSSVATSRGSEGTGAKAAQRKREQVLLAKVRKDPKNGALKVELAKARMEGGKYDVERLLVSGMKQGGNKREATLLLVAALTVQKRYSEAMRWLGGSGLGSRTYYKEALEYAMGKRIEPPQARGPKLTEQLNMTNAFNYYLAGLVEEKSGNYEDAAEGYSKAYEMGLRGKPVVERIVESYKRTDKDFKESERGVEIISNFADAFVGNP